MVEYIRIETNICRLLWVEYGTKQILTINPALGEVNEYCFQMMD